MRNITGSLPIEVKRQSGKEDPRKAHEQSLEGFTLHCSPDDFPGKWVIRGWRVLKNGALAFEERPRVFGSRKDAEEYMRPLRLQWINRHYTDAICVVGSWI